VSKDEEHEAHRAIVLDTVRRHLGDVLDCSKVINDLAAHCRLLKHGRRRKSRLYFDDWALCVLDVSIII